jgi:hypothetical protein
LNFLTPVNPQLNTDNRLPTAFKQRGRSREKQKQGTCKKQKQGTCKKYKIAWKAEAEEARREARDMQKMQDRKGSRGHAKNAR